MKRSRGQECHYHAVIGEIARAREVSKECAKRVMVAKFYAEWGADPEFAGMWPVDLRTSQFPMPLAVAFLHFLYAWVALNVE